MVRSDLHLNHLVSLRYNIHIVTNHTMYIHTLEGGYHTHTCIPMNYILHNLLQIFTPNISTVAKELTDVNYTTD